MPEVGRILGDRYRLIELLGEGGMATIYRAHDRQLDRDVAVKLLRPQYGRDAGFIARFRQEAQSAASLNHPNVVNVFDYGTDLAGPFIVMELIDGENLAEILRERGFLPPPAAAGIAEQIADGLSVAHERGIVHRDIKPSNILLTRDGRAKVVDFGIARALVEAQLTLPGTTLGSVHYFSPEQARGEPVTAASDLYSLGLVLFEMLTGQRAWTGDTAGAVALARLGNPPPRPSSLRADVPPALDAIVARALALDPQDRFASAGTMAAALGSFLADPSAGLAAAAAFGAARLVPTDAAGENAATPTVRGPGSAGTGLGSLIDGVEGRAAGTRPGGVRPTAGIYPPGVYEPSSLAPVGGAPIEPEPAERQTGTGWVWAAGVLAVVILLLAASGVALLASRGFFSAPTPAVATVQVPSVLGLRLADAQRTAADQGLTITISGASPGGVGITTVATQDPAPGVSARRGSAIAVTLQTVQAMSTVPDLRGMSLANAGAGLARSGLAVGPVTQVTDQNMPVGEVVSTNPSAGIQVTAGTAVALNVSSGPSPAPTSPTFAPTPFVTPPPTQLPTLLPTEPPPTVPPTEPPPTAAPSS
jgi:serine/threonine-protein kinase